MRVGVALLVVLVIMRTVHKQRLLGFPSAAAAAATAVRKATAGVRASWQDSVPGRILAWNLVVGDAAVLLPKRVKLCLLRVVLLVRRDDRDGTGWLGRLADHVQLGLPGV